MSKKKKQSWQKGPGVNGLKEETYFIIVKEIYKMMSSVHGSNVFTVKVHPYVLHIGFKCNIRWQTVDLYFVHFTAMVQF